ncbi:glucosyl transferase domain protein [Shigella flexneri K-227]|uniref:Glucosyl transferase domain protein n=2 Tax=Shigella flexneri TaxID=623 RepID=F5NS41_SHIFL|nr:glucosyl transferase domain protein [Shigella flexneri K-272]EGK39685.1 glucosyl transferase domain protein [Shigella flexneri K-227]
MKVFATLPILIVTFSMAKPQLADSVPQLPTLATGNGSRYFVNIL